MHDDTPRRSDVTRAAILEAARAHFAADGYERATIRAIAADAGIDPAMVMRYHGSKSRLFAAAADFDLRLPDLTPVPRHRVGAALAEHAVDRWASDDTLHALLRAAVSHDDASTTMRAIFVDQLAPTIRRLHDATGGGGSADARAGLVATQVLGFMLCRHVLRLPPVVQMPDDEVVAWLAPTLQRYLVEDLD